MDSKYEKFINKLIVFEKPADHSGGTTLANALHDKLREEGISVILTKQPGGLPGEFGSILRSICIDKKWNLNPIANLFAFLLDRSEHTDKIVIPALSEGKTVICDRWWYSTIAYQFYGKELIKNYNLNEEFANWMNKVASFDLKPDVVFFIERDQQHVDETEDSQEDQFETETREFKLRVKNAYYHIAKNNPLFIRIPVIENNIEETLEQILTCDL